MRRLLTIVALCGCARGSADEPHVLATGLYELQSIEVEGSCALADAVTPGQEYMGKMAQVRVTARDTSVTLEPCDPFFANECFPMLTVGSVSMVREYDLLESRDAHWPVPSCPCFEEYRGQRTVEGEVIEDGHAELRWTFDLPTSPSDCFCEQAACTATLGQRLTNLR